MVDRLRFTSDMEAAAHRLGPVFKGCGRVSVTYDDGMLSYISFKSGDRDDLYLLTGGEWREYREVLNEAQ